MKNTELVLVHPRRFLPESWREVKRSAIQLHHSQLNSFIPNPPEFIPRHQAETDPEYKQWIPYLITVHTGRIGVYSRSGSEQRLHGCLSLGLGGHVNPCDQTAPTDWPQTILNGALREISEELPGPAPAFHSLGVINEEETPVGHTHIGMVFVAILPQTHPLRPSRELANLQWLSFHRIHRYMEAHRFEIWSTLAWQLLVQQPELVRQITGVSDP